jgi:hypothetical protein
MIVFKIKMAKDKNIIFEEKMLPKIDKLRIKMESALK